jgi:glucose/arabinose dehydrogenase
LKPGNLIILVIGFLSPHTNSNCQYPRQTQTLIPFATGLSNPVGMANAGDNRLFVVDQRGSVVIVDSAGHVNPEPFLDISDSVVFDGEQGLLGIAFHPDYKANGYFFVNYTGEGDSTHIARFSTIAGNPDKADPLSELKILAIPQPFQNHNGGTLCFGPDGYLYIGLGDGGSGGDPGDRAQNEREMLGKMLRIGVDSESPYSIPVTNPFYGHATVLNEIWALGLRNPWKFSFDRLTGDLWIADVGQNQLEEINFQPAASEGGENYGWRCYEGNEPYNTEECAPVDSFTFPVNTYPHGSDCSVTGGYVYRGDPSSPYYGYYFFADYCSDRIWTLHNESGGWSREDYGRFPGNGFSTFGEDFKGNLYIAGRSSGNIYRLSDQLTGIPDGEIPAEIKILRFPSSNRFRIEINQEYPAISQLAIFDIRGITHFQAITSNNVFEIDLESLSAGIYLIQVQTNGKDMVHRVVVEK